MQSYDKTREVQNENLFFFGLASLTAAYNCDLQCRGCWQQASLTLEEVPLQKIKKEVAVRISREPPWKSYEKKYKKVYLN